jgi:hypothetical protein
MAPTLRENVFSFSPAVLLQLGHAEFLMVYSKAMSLGRFFSA